MRVYKALSTHVPACVTDYLSRVAARLNVVKELNELSARDRLLSCPAMTLP